MSPADTSGPVRSPSIAGPVVAPVRTPGWREVLLVAVAIVAVVLGAAALTGLLPPSAQDVVFRTPLAIVVLLVGTVGLLLRLSLRRPSA